jgi:hypothetical protein
MTLRLRELSDHEQAEVQRIARSHTLGAGLVPLHRDYDTLAGSG